MDTSDAEIEFDEHGICNHCTQAIEMIRKRIPVFREGQLRLELILERVKQSGKNRSYDCVVGLSGGVDSTYVLYLAKTLGLRPLAVHFDNGWNSELAVSNIETAVRALNVDLITHVMDWHEFRDIQLAFFKASVPDLEIPTDHAIYASLYRALNTHGLRFILTGSNLASESILPLSWAYGHHDWKYIRSVHALFGTRSISSFPHYSLLKYGYWLAVKKLTGIAILNAVDYDRSSVIETLKKELGWRDYGLKHHESIITRFLQGYILPIKFGIDKRKAHFSSLIVSGQMTREQALELLKSPPYAESLMREDRLFIAKKLGLTEDEFENHMRAKPKSFRDFPTSYHFYEFCRIWFRKAQHAGLIPGHIARSSF